MTDLVSATWVAGYRAQLPDGTELEPGVTVADIPASEAKTSGNWKPVKAPKPSGDASDVPSTE